MNGDYYASKRESDLARAYIPFQYMNQVYSPSEALQKGTLFPELYRPYRVERGNRDGGGYNG